MSAGSSKWVGVKWVYSMRGGVGSLILENGRVKEGPKWAKGKMIDKALATIKSQGGSAECVGVYSSAKSEGITIRKKKASMGAPREVTKGAVYMKKAV